MGVERCEVCAAEGPGLVELALETRSVLLCRRHAARAREAGAHTFADLRRLFVEAEGRRSLVDRRGASTRRQFPPRPEGRRLGGRRWDDE